MTCFRRATSTRQAEISAKRSAISLSSTRGLMTPRGRTAAASIFDAAGAIDFSVGDFRESSLSIRFIAGGTGATAIFPVSFSDGPSTRFAGCIESDGGDAGAVAAPPASGFGSVSTAGCGCAHPGTVNASASPAGSANPNTSFARKPHHFPPAITLMPNLYTSCPPARQLPARP